MLSFSETNKPAALRQASRNALQTNWLFENEKRAEMHCTSTRFCSTVTYVRLALDQSGQLFKKSIQQWLD